MASRGNDINGRVQRSDLVERLSITGHSRWMGTWTFYAIAVLVGLVIAGKASVRVDDMVFGMPLSWLVGWTYERGKAQLAVAMAISVTLIGLLVGLLT